MPDLEVIAVENASEDESLAILQAVAGSDSRLVVVPHEHNVGAAAGRNDGIRRARGEWVAFLDADDWWAAERLERLLAAAGGADVVSDDLCVVREGDPSRTEADGRSFLRHIGLDIQARHELSLLEFIRFDLGLLKPMIRRRFLVEHELGYDERFRIVHDFPLWASLLALGARWVQLPEAYYFYSRAPQSLSTRQREMIQEVVDSTDALLADPSFNFEPAAIEAFRRRKRDWEGHAAFAEVADRLRARDLAGLARLVRRQPDSVPLILRRQARHLRLRLARRARDPLRPSPPRLL